MYQSIILIGHVGREPELRYNPNGKAVCNFSLATTEKRWNDQDESTPVTTWWRVTCWSKNAENVSKYVKKGSKVLVSGTMNPGVGGNPTQFQKKDGTWASGYDLTARSVRFLDSKPGDDEDEQDGDW